MQLEIERQALKKEKDKASKERLEKLEKEVADLRERSTELHTRWKTEKDAISSLQGVKEQIEQTRTEIERAERQADLEKAARLRYGSLRELESKLAEGEQRIKALQKEGALLKEEVDAEEIAQIVGRWTGIPVSRLLEGETEKLIHMEERCTSGGRTGWMRCGWLSNAVRRARAGLQDPNRPDWLIHLPGPTGVGKTELARALAEIPVRRRAGDDPHRYERIPGEAYRLALVGRRLDM